MPSYRLFFVTELPGLPEFPETGRVFGERRKVRLGDCNENGRMRLDALLRFAQDLSDDDTTSAELAANSDWVVRSVSAKCAKPAAYGESLDMRTACSGLGSRWAERRIEIWGDQGSSYELAVMWICLDPVTHRPKPLSSDFLEIFGTAAAGRKVRASRLLDLDHSIDEAHRFVTRVSDFDVFGHMNNAAYGALIEQLSQGSLEGPFTTLIDFYSGVPITDEVSASVRAEGDQKELVFWYKMGQAAAAIVQKD